MIVWRQWKSLGRKSFNSSYTCIWSSRYDLKENKYKFWEFTEEEVVITANEGPARL